MANFVLDSGVLDSDWLALYYPSASTITGGGANGGAGLIEIYYLTPTSPPAPPANDMPTVNLYVGGVAEVQDYYPFVINTLRVDNAIGQRGIANFQIWDPLSHDTVVSHNANFLNGGNYVYTTAPSSDFALGAEVRFNPPVPAAITAGKIYYVGDPWGIYFRPTLSQNGSDYVTWVTSTNIQATAEFCEFDPYAFSIGQNIELKVDAVSVWTGVIERMNKKLPSSSGIMYYIQGVSWNYALDKRRVVQAYNVANPTSTAYGGSTGYSSELNCGFIVRDIIENYLAVEGVTAGTISSGGTLNSCVFNYIKPSAALDRLAEQSGYIWQINADKSLDFKPRDSETFSFTVYSSDISRDSIQYIEGSPKYRNVQYVVGGMDLTSTQNEYQYGDSKKRAFTLPFPAMQAPTISVVEGTSSTSRSVGILGIDTTKQFYWNKYSNIISQQSSDTALSTAQQLHIEYIGGFPTVARVEDGTGITELRANEGGSGLVEDAILRGQDSIYDDNLTLAANLISQYSTVCDTLKFKTFRTGISPGKILKIDLPEFDLSSEEFLVDSVSIRDIDGIHLQFDVTALSGYDHGGWSKFFEDLITKTVEKDIWEGSLTGELLTVGGTVTETGSWTSVLASTDFQCLTPSDTLYPASSNYPC